MAHIIVIARCTVKELMRSRVLYGVFGLVLLLLLCATFFGTVTIGSQGKVIKDFSLFLVSLSSAGLAIFSGTSLLNKELSRKTIYNILSKPVRRSEFILGKFIGMFGACCLLILLMMPMCILYLRLFEPYIDYSLVVGAYYMILEAAVLCAAALFFSSIVMTPALSGVLVFALFLAGRSVESLNYFINSPEVTEQVKVLLQGLYMILPQLNRFMVGDALVYGVIPTGSYALASGVYAVSYTGILLVLGIVIFNRKELQ